MVLVHGVQVEARRGNSEKRFKEIARSLTVAHKKTYELTELCFDENVRAATVCVCCYR